MRVTQSMLSGNMLRNLSSSYSKMGKLQNQITSGSKISRPSDDPVVAIKGMGFRTSLDKVEQYTRNMNEVNSWIDNSDDSLDKVGNALIRVQQLITQATNDTNDPGDREKIKAEIDQIKLQIQDLANSKIGDKYIFSGTNTSKPLFDANGAILTPAISPGLTEEVKIEVYDGVQLTVNVKDAAALFGKIDSMMDDISKALTAGDPTNNATAIGALLGDISDNHALVLEERADIGAKQNRVEMMTNRLEIQEVMVTKQLSDNESVEYEKAITEMVTQEAIHQAALSVGSKIIQATLVDFIR